jgi:hypothetical protein
MALSACATTDSRSPEPVAVASNTVSQFARLTVFRTTESAQYYPSATLSIDGIVVGAIESAGFNTFDVPAGSHVLNASVWESPPPQTCKLQIDVVGGSAYYYEVVPRTTPGTGNFATSLPGAITGSLGVIGALVTGVIGIIGILAPSSSGAQCGVAIVSVHENMALPKLDLLRKSK